MRQRRVNRTDVRRARRSRQRRRELRSPDVPIVRSGGGPDVDDDLLQRITRVIDEATAATPRRSPHTRP